MVYFEDLKDPIKLYIDGDLWCALIGDNIHSGLVGWGDSPVKALQDLTFVWEDSTAIEIAKYQNVTR